MALTQENLTQYFEKSERLDMLRERIKKYTTRLQETYGDLTFGEVRDMSMRERQLNSARTDRQTEKIIFPLGYIEFSWGIDSGDPALCPYCRFYLVAAGDKWYNLTKEQLPNEYVEQVYNALPRLTELMKVARRIATTQIEDEILAFIQQ